MKGNGLSSFGFHLYDDHTQQLNKISSGFNLEGFNTDSKTDINPEVIAGKYLEGFFTTQQVNSLQAGNDTGNIAPAASFDPVKTEYLPLTGNKIVRFRQRLNKISVFGSVANVELDKDNNFVSVNSSLAAELPAVRTAAISAQQARAIAADELKQEIPENVVPMLYYYFHEEEWKLVFILKDILVRPPEGKPAYETEGGAGHESPFLMNVIIDSQNGKVLEVTPGMIGFRVAEKGIDANNEMQDFFASDSAGGKVLIDDNLMVTTYSNNFNFFYSGSMPGVLVAKKGNTWSPAAVSAHVNACKVALFLRNSLKRNSVDGAGLAIVSSVDCTSKPGDNIWENAAWMSDRKQMAYGQVEINGQLKSLAASLDVVGHEIFHGVTQFTAGLIYHGQTGAMNESYSDIFGIIISNAGNNDPAKWNWELGEAISGKPFRSLQQPSLFKQPEHMNDYRDLPDTRDNDWGGVHINSGIHNKAAFLLITDRQPDNQYTFSAEQVAQLYYYCLLQLSENSTFSDSYRGMLIAAKSLFANDASLPQKLNAIDRAFAGAGIK